MLYQWFRSFFPTQPGVRLRVNVIIEEDEGSFHAYAPALKGLHVDGATRAEAAANAEEAVCVYIQSLIDHGDALPVGLDLVQGHAGTPPKSQSEYITVQCPSPEMFGISSRISPQIG